jgi:leader peptidase (prepilin peptidase)/N-methyltransferase
MGFEPIFREDSWTPVPFHFWSAAFFVFGTIVGSFLNVVIHRLPRGESIVSPPSHCPHCNYTIPWYLNIPLFTWVMVRGKCRHCGELIAPRYFLVELLTGLLFLGCWLNFGNALHPFASIPHALTYCILLGGLIAATFIDFEHLIIPDEITLGGIVVGLFCSFFVPALQDQVTITAGMKQSALGAAAGGGIIYLVLRGGKLLFGRQQVNLAPETKIVLSETALVLPDHQIPYEEIFYRRSDTIVIRARHVELVDRCYANATVRLSQKSLRIDDDRFIPEEVPHLEAVTAGVQLPREAMGLGDVKFMAAIGSFLGWPAVIFSLMASSLIGSLAGLLLILFRRAAWSGRLPYGPYIALAATLWVFLPPSIHADWTSRLKLVGEMFATLVTGNSF